MCADLWKYSRWATQQFAPLDSNNFFNQPKPNLVPLIISSLQPVSSPAMPQENAPNTEMAVSAQGDGQNDLFKSLSNPESAHL